MGKTINACGLTCPGPVLLVKDEVEQSAPREITVLVDNAGSMENVSRFLTSRGYSVIDSRQDGVFRLDARCDQKTATRRPLRKKSLLAGVIFQNRRILSSSPVTV